MCVSGERTDCGGMRLSLRQRIRDDVGVVAARIQSPRAEYADLLGVHGKGDRRGNHSIQFWSLQSRLGYTPIQDAMGRTRGNALVVRACWQTERDYAIAERRNVSVGPA